MGEKIREKVKEILETGQLRAAEAAKETYSLKAHDELQGVYGIGPTKATELIRKGIHSVEELRQKVLEDKTILNDKQRIGLLYYEDLLQRIPRLEMTEHETLLLHAPMNAELVGSYRRRAETSGDIDVLLRAPKGQTVKDTQSMFYQYVQRLVDDGYIQEILALGPHKCMAIARLPSRPSRRLDLLVTPDEEYACALLYFTGSDRFNVAFRQHALQKGYTLNEHRLQRQRQRQEQEQEQKDSSEIPYMTTEHDLFDFLGLEYVAPHDRVDVSSLRMKQKPLRVKRPIRA
jgi:DNA polymerase lambda